MSLSSEYYDEEKKKKKKKTGDTLSDEYYEADAKVKENSEESSPIIYTPKKNKPKMPDDDIAPVDDRKWFQKGAFEDGYQFGDILRTINATSDDLANNIMAGILGIGEKAVDAGAYVAGAVGGLFGADEFKEKTKEFIAKDLYDEEKVAVRGFGTVLAYAPLCSGGSAVLPQGRAAAGPAGPGNHHPAL